MANHLAALGIGSESPEERQEQVRRILGNSRPHSQRGDGMTLRWSDVSGAELWIYVDGEGTMKWVQPHFSGGPRIDLELQEIVERPEISPHDGGFIGLTRTGGSNPALGGGFPVIFDAPDFPDVRDAFLTSRHEVELAAFAVDVNAYESEEDFKAAQPEMKPLEIPAFIPAGLLGKAQGAGPTAHALMVGRLLKAERVTNTLTDRAFFKLLVETPAGPMVLVVEPDLLPKIPTEGSLLQAGAWISGRIAPEDDEK